MSRPSFRARPIDIAQALAIVRDESVLNDESQAVAREVTHAHKNLDKDNEEVRRPRPFPRAPPFHFTGWTHAKAWSSSSKMESPLPADLTDSGRSRPHFPRFFRPAGHSTSGSIQSRRQRGDRLHPAAPRRACPEGLRCWHTRIGGFPPRQYLT